MIELNLLPDVKRDFVRAQRTRRQVIAAMILLSMAAGGLVVALALYVYGGQFAIGQVLDGAIKDKSKQLANVKDLDDYLTIQNQLRALPALHSDKFVYARLFDFLPTLNPAPPNNIHITRLTASEEEGTVTIVGYARDYKAVTVFENTIKNAELSYTDNESGEQKTESFVKDIAMSEVNLSEDASGNRVVAFTASLTNGEGSYKRGISNVRLQVPNRDTTQSAQQVPQEVFSEGGQE
ncbi:Fimbrial assembly family protein [candidate division TM7 genomosp. GTL1]|nr:Fimbrial assembly family protein [candidate division TM7 genomosp. GTL1]